MIEDPVLTEYRVDPISPDKIVHTEDSEVAYDLGSVSHGTCETTKECKEKLKDIAATANTLGFEIDLECDFAPSTLKTYNSDKTLNAEYGYGEHQPGGNRHQESCKFQVGQKVLCVIHEGYDAVFPGIVVGPLTEEYLRKLYETDTELQIGYSSVDEDVEKWPDWHWDSVIVRPLVRLKNDWEVMSETVMVNRVYVFSYKKFEV